MTIHIDASELRTLAADLGKVPARAVTEIRGAVGKSTKDVETSWRDNARATAGKHGKHYPAAITSDVRYGFGVIAGQVGPERGRKQGGMSFEHGSINQEPHLDGAQAADKHEAAFVRSIADVAQGVLEL